MNWLLNGFAKASGHYRKGQNFVYNLFFSERSAFPSPVFKHALHISFKDRQHVRAVLVASHHFGD